TGRPPPASSAARCRARRTCRSGRTGRRPRPVPAGDRCAAPSGSPHRASRRACGPLPPTVRAPSANGPPSAARAPPPRHSPSYDHSDRSTGAWRTWPSTGARIPAGTLRVHVVEVGRMIPSLVAGEVRRALVDYLATTFDLADDDVREALAEFLTDPDTGIFRGPYLRVRTPFRSVEAGWTSPLGWLPEWFT